MTAPSPSEAPRRVTLLTDFGTADGYAATMKGVIAAHAPAALIDDASHSIDAGDIHEGAVALLRYWRHYPPGSVHVVVVDPGVGSERRAVAVEADGRYLVGPDNGVLSLALEIAGEWTAVEIRNEELLPERVSETFHGRDVFAPAAGWLAAGGRLDELGPPTPELVRLELPEPRRERDCVHGAVIAVDRFGNLITNIPADWVDEDAHIHLGHHDAGPVRTTYSAVSAGELLVVKGSLGLVEISVRDGSAWELLGTGRGADVTIR